MDDKVCDANSFSQNRERLLRSDVAQAFFEHTENCNGLVAWARLTHAYDKEEARAVPQMLESQRGGGRVKC